MPVDCQFARSCPPAGDGPGHLPRAAMRGGPAWAQMKRFVECCLADPALVERARRDPAAAAAEAGIAVDPLAFRAVWDVGHGQDGQDLPPLTRHYLAVQQARLAARDRMRADCAEQVVPRYAAWRRRQMARSALELSPHAVETIIHSPLSVELSQGCSGGCWFCGLDAPRLSAVHPYTEDNGRQWRAMLAGLRRVIGPAVRHGFCYWATDPLDNPDYERFSSDFHDVLGVFPQFTTALALRDPERTRRLLRLAEERQGVINRFSLLSLRQLAQAHAAFSAEDLAMVDCLPQNPQSRIVLAQAGRARARQERAGDGAPQRAALASTIACVSGFLINMVERTVKLISPCPASARWPLGYRLWAQAGFAHGDDLLAGVQDMIDHAMPQSVADLPTVRFDDILTFTPLADGFRLNSDWRELRYRHPDPASPHCAYLRDLGGLVAEGTSTAGDIAVLACYRHGVPAETTLRWLDGLFGKGLLREAA